VDSEDIAASEAIMDGLLETFTELEGYELRREHGGDEPDRWLIVLLKGDDELMAGQGDTAVEAAMDAVEMYRDGLAVSY
jgi:hypothetical protein